jgi:hypothetical protein
MVMTVIRVVKSTTNDFGPFNAAGFRDVVTEIVWKGSDIDELSREYPPSEVFDADPLGHSEIEDGFIRFDYKFERQIAANSWEEIDDPRRRITPVTEREQEIDAENRRLFPGDYFTGCDNCGYDSCDGQCQNEAICKICKASCLVSDMNSHGWCDVCNDNVGATLFNAEHTEAWCMLCHTKTTVSEMSVFGWCNTCNQIVSADITSAVQSAQK